MLGVHADVQENERGEVAQDATAEYDGMPGLLLRGTVLRRIYTCAVASCACGREASQI